MQSGHAAQAADKDQVIVSPTLIYILFLFFLVCVCVWGCNLVQELPKFDELMTRSLARTSFRWQPLGTMPW